jgi:hypothetical protein
MRRNKTSTRSLVVFLMVWSFIVLTVTGLILYVAPLGCIAFWTHWRLLGLGKEQWGGLHVISGVMLLVTGALHLYFKWKPFKKNLSELLQTRLRSRQELILSLVLTLILVGLSVANLPPASWVLQLNDAVKSAWVSSPELEPPFAHAEEVSLAGLAKRMGLDLGQSLSRLWDAGLVFNGPQDSLQQIALGNDTTPMAVYGLIRGAKQQGEPVIGPLTPKDVEAWLGGSGLGRKTLGQICAAAGLEESIALRRLNKLGISASAQDKAKSVAERYDLTPMDLVKIMMIPGFQPDA